MATLGIKNKTGIKQSKISDSHKFCVLRKHLEGNKILSVVHCLFVSCTSKENMGYSLEEPFLFRRRSLQKYNNNINNYYCTWIHVVKSFPINDAFVSFLSPCFQKQMCSAFLFSTYNSVSHQKKPFKQYAWKAMISHNQLDNKCITRQD